MFFRYGNVTNFKYHTLVEALQWNILVARFLILTIVVLYVQIWESLWRFSEVLGLEEPISFEELEEEL